MITVNEILTYLCKLYPVNTACDFDNVGLLVGDGFCEVKSAIISLDCDVNTIEFAKENGANLIITHHPVIFQSLKSVTENSIVYSLIKDGISVISMHTNLDVGRGGVNDTLCEVLNLKSIKSYTANDGYVLKCGKTDISDADEFARFIKEKLGGNVRYVSGSKPIKNVLVCSGSGGSYLSEAIAGGFDALITADVKHNVFIDAINSDISLFDGGHFNTENIIVDRLYSLLSKKFKDISFSPYGDRKIKTV